MPPLGRVLVVEDEVLVAAVLREALVDFGYIVKIAVSGHEALQLVPVFRPDVVLLDLWLPGMRGEEVLARLRQVEPELPVVIVSANRDEEIARGMLAEGVFDYVPKPFELAVLERIVAAAILQRGEARQLEEARRGRHDDVIRGTVLYIDDNPANVLLVERLLEQRPAVQLLTAPDGRGGLTLARERRPDLILLDLHLPDMEGEDVLRAIREAADLGQTPVIVLSAEAQPDLPGRVRAAGALGYLMTPLDFEQFFASVDAGLSRGGGPLP